MSASVRHRHLRDSNDLKPIVCDTVYEIGSLDFDRLYSRSDWGEERNECYNPEVTLSQENQLVIGIELLRLWSNLQQTCWLRIRAGGTCV